MKTTTITLALLAALSAMAGAHASEFEGGFVGARVGDNHSDISGTTTAGGKDTTTYGIEGGYNWDIQSFLLGVDIFADSNSKADHTAVPTNNYGSNAYGVDLKLGLPTGSWMPYARLGYAQTNGTSGASPISGGDLHGGVGIEYKFTPSWGVNAEWDTSSAKTNGSKLENDNFTIGVRYYFGVAKAAPVPMAADPVVEPPVAAPAPVVAPVPAPQPKESWKTILTETPVRLEGANFANNSAKLLKTADMKLNEVVKAVNQYGEVKLEVSGHTDNRGKKAFNQKLSEKRAAAVKSWLVKHGVAADRISTVGYADTQPIADNKTKVGRAANRRVEVHYVIQEEKKVRVTE
jgi:OOP family OmpA-OmpF porin